VTFAPLAFAARRLVVAPDPTIGAFAWYVGNLRDGRIGTQVPVTSTSWSLVMDDAGKLEATAYLGDQDVRDLDLWTTAAVARSFLALAYVAPDGTETFLEAGPVWRLQFNAARHTLQIGAAGLWSYFDHRKVMPVLAAGQAPASVSSAYSALPLGTIAKRLVQLAATHTGGDLPVVLPDDETAADDADHQRTSPGWELDKVGDMLRNLTTVSGGPEIRFRPQRSTTDERFLEWVLETGTEADPMLHQPGADHYWDGSVSQSSLSDLDVVIDGNGMGSRAWARGAGQEAATLIGVADDTTLTDAGYPLLELDVTGYETEESASVVDKAAAGGLLGAGGPVVTFTATVRRDEFPMLGTYQVGDWSQVVVADHDLVPDGTYRSRVTQISGDDTDQVKVDLAPTIGSIVNG
jgi:hypothetical protein